MYIAMNTKLMNEFPSKITSRVSMGFLCFLMVRCLSRKTSTWLVAPDNVVSLLIRLLTWQAFIAKYMLSAVSGQKFQKDWNCVCQNDFKKIMCGKVAYPILWNFDILWNKECMK